MAGEKVISGNMRLNIDGKTVYHATDATLTMTREVRERATKDTEGTEKAKGIKNFSASANALGAYNSDGTSTNDFSGLFQLYNDDSTDTVDIEFVPSESDATKKYTGKAIIDNLELNMPNEEDSTASINLSGSGVITEETIV